MYNKWSCKDDNNEQSADSANRTIMTNYKSARNMDGKIKWVIEDEHGNINKNPTREELKLSILDDRRNPRVKISYHGRSCCICGNNHTYINNSCTVQWRRHKCGKKDCTEWLCLDCFTKHDLNSQCNVLKSMANSRTCQLATKVTSRKGMVGEAIIAKVRKLEVISIEIDNFVSKFDLSVDKEYGMIQSKLKGFDQTGWTIEFGMEHNFDTLFAMCTDKFMNNITGTYIIPEEELYGKKDMYISKNDFIWEKFRTDEKPYNDAFKDLISYLNNKSFGVDNIKRWIKS